MARDPLAILLRVRRAALDEARRALADCLAVEAIAAETLTEAEADIVRERMTAASLDADDAAVEAFAAWLRIARGRTDQARASHERFIAETARARAIVAVAQGSLEIAQTASDQRAVDEREARQRREQLNLDEAVQSRQARARTHDR
jgi:putative NADH-flavin reductase